MIPPLLRIGILATCLVLQAQASSAAPKPPVGIKLSEGPLALVSGTDSSATFIEPDTIVWTGKTAIVMTYTVFEPPHAIAKGKIVVQAVNRNRIDCEARTRQDLGSEGYDEAGKSLVWLPEEPAKAIAPNTSHDFVARVVCDKVELPPTNVAQGHVAARALALRALAAQRQH